MSATNRGGIRRPSDHYPTPEWCTRIVINRIPEYDILDPCAGDGAILRVAKSMNRRPWAKELRPECMDALSDVCGPRVRIGDAIADAWPESFAPNMAVVTNPPFSLAREFVDTYTTRVAASAFLLRLNFLGSMSRATWWAANPPAQVLVLSRRPSFTDDGKTDATEYAWFIWRGRTARGDTRMEVVA